MSDKDSSAVYNIVAFNFDGKDTAKETIEEAKDAGALDGYDIVVEAIVEQDEKGKVHGTIDALAVEIVVDGTDNDIHPITIEQFIGEKVILVIMR